MDEEALDRQLREVLDPLGVELYGTGGASEDLQETRRKPAQRSGPFIEIVCVYAEEDERYWEQLFEHFAVVKDDRLSWHPWKVSKRWQVPTEELLGELEQAHMVLVLVSVHLLLALVHSDRRIEETLARIAHYEAQAFASFAVVLRPCAWEDYQFAQLSVVLPKNGRPVTHWRRREAAYVEVVQAVCTAIETA